MKFKKSGLALISFFGYSNLFIALCAFFLSIQTARIFNLNNVIPLALFNAGSTFIVYNLQRLFQFYSQQTILPQRKQWLQQNLFYLIALIIAAIFYLSYEVYKHFYFIIPYYSILFIISLCYFIPGINLRKLPFLKIFIISFTWIFSCCVLPCTIFLKENGIYHFTFTMIKPGMLGYFCSQFLLMAALCIPFDIRDLEYDQLNGVKTFPVLMGIQQSKRVTYLLIVLYFLIAFFISSTSNLIVVYGITSFLTGVIIYKTKASANKNFLFLLLME